MSMREEKKRMTTNLNNQQYMCRLMIKEMTTCSICTIIHFEKEGDIKMRELKISSNMIWYDCVTYNEFSDDDYIYKKNVYIIDDKSILINKIYNLNSSIRIMVCNKCWLSDKTIYYSLYVTLQLMKWVTVIQMLIYVWKLSMNNFMRWNV